MDDSRYIGMDVHQASIVASVMDASGKVVMESILETRADTVVQFVRGLSGTLWVTFEEGVSAAWLHDLLKPHVAGVVVCDPRKNALLKSGNKNDQIDAHKLAHVCRTRRYVIVNNGAVFEVGHYMTYSWPLAGRGGSSSVILRARSTEAAC
jgi:transposase